VRVIADSSERPEDVAVTCALFGEAIEISAQDDSGIETSGHCFFWPCSLDTSAPPEESVTFKMHFTIRNADSRRTVSCRFELPPIMLQSDRIGNTKLQFFLDKQPVLNWFSQTMKPSSELKIHVELSIKCLKDACGSLLVKIPFRTSELSPDEQPTVHVRMLVAVLRFHPFPVQSRKPEGKKISPQQDEVSARLSHEELVELYPKIGQLVHSNAQITSLMCCVDPIIFRKAIFPHVERGCQDTALISILKELHILDETRLAESPTCPVCLELWDAIRDPVILSICQHCLCRPCVEKLLSQSAPMCPLCRVPFTREHSLLLEAGTEKFAKLLCSSAISKTFPSSVTLLKKAVLDGLFDFSQDEKCRLLLLLQLFSSRSLCDADKFSLLLRFCRMSSKESALQLSPVFNAIGCSLSEPDVCNASNILFGLLADAFKSRRTDAWVLTYIPKVADDLFALACQEGGTISFSEWRNFIHIVVETFCLDFGDNLEIIEVVVLFNNPANDPFKEIIQISQAVNTVVVGCARPLNRLCTLLRGPSADRIVEYFNYNNPWMGFVFEALFTSALKRNVGPHSTCMRALTEGGIFNLALLPLAAAVLDNSPSDKSSSHFLMDMFFALVELRVNDSLDKKVNGNSARSDPAQYIRNCSCGSLTLDQSQEVCLDINKLFNSDWQECNFDNIAALVIGPDKTLRGSFKAFSSLSIHRDSSAFSGASFAKKLRECLTLFRDLLHLLFWHHCFDVFDEEVVSYIDRWGSRLSREEIFKLLGNFTSRIAVENSRPRDFPAPINLLHQSAEILQMDFSSHHSVSKFEIVRSLAHIFSMIVPPIVSPKSKDFCFHKLMIIRRLTEGWAYFLKLPLEERIDLVVETHDFLLKYAQTPSTPSYKEPPGELSQIKSEVRALASSQSLPKRKFVLKVLPFFFFANRKDDTIAEKNLALVRALLSLAAVVLAESPAPLIRPALQALLTTFCPHPETCIKIITGGLLLLQEDHTAIGDEHDRCLQWMAKMQSYFSSIDSQSCLSVYTSVGIKLLLHERNSTLESSSNLIDDVLKIDSHEGIKILSQVLKFRVILFSIFHCPTTNWNGYVTLSREFLQLSSELNKELSQFLFSQKRISDGILIEVLGSIQALASYSAMVAHAGCSSFRRIITIQMGLSISKLVRDLGSLRVLPLGPLSSMQTVDEQSRRELTIPTMDSEEASRMRRQAAYFMYESSAQCFRDVSVEKFFDNVSLTWRPSSSHEEYSERLECQTKERGIDSEVNSPPASDDVLLNKLQQFNVPQRLTETSESLSFALQIVSDLFHVRRHREWRNITLRVAASFLLMKQASQNVFLAVGVFTSNIELLRSSPAHGTDVVQSCAGLARNSLVLSFRIIEALHYLKKVLEVKGVAARLQRSLSDSIDDFSRVFGQLRAEDFPPDLESLKMLLVKAGCLTASKSSDSGLTDFIIPEGLASSSLQEASIEFQKGITADFSNPSSFEISFSEHGSASLSGFEDMLRKDAHSGPRFFEELSDVCDERSDSVRSFSRIDQDYRIAEVRFQKSASFGDSTIRDSRSFTSAVTSPDSSLALGSSRRHFPTRITQISVPDVSDMLHSSFANSAADGNTEPTTDSSSVLVKNSKELSSQISEMRKKMKLEDIVHNLAYKAATEVSQYRDPDRYPVARQVEKPTYDLLCKFVSALRREILPQVRKRIANLAAAATASLPMSTEFEFCFLVDTSASMSGAPMYFALEALTLMMETFKRLEFSFGVVKFQGQQKQAVLKKLDQPMSSSTGQFIVESCLAEPDFDGTYPDAALRFVVENAGQLGFSQARGKGSPHQILLLITDGISAQTVDMDYKRILNGNGKRLLMLTINESAVVRKKLVDVVQLIAGQDSVAIVSPDNITSELLRIIFSQIDQVCAEAARIEKISTSVPQVVDGASSQKFQGVCSSPLSAELSTDPKEIISLFNFNDVITWNNSSTQSKLYALNPVASDIPQLDSSVGHQREVDEKLFFDAFDAQTAKINAFEHTTQSNLLSVSGECWIQLETSLAPNVDEMVAVLQEAVLPANRFTKRAPAFSGPTLDMRGLIRYIVTDGEYKKIFQKKSAGGVRDYHFALCLDTSASMMGNPMKSSFYGLALFIQALRRLSLDRFYLLSFARQVILHKTSRNSWNHAVVLSVLSSIFAQPENVSNDADAVDNAVELLSRVKGPGGKYVLVFTDGFGSQPQHLPRSLERARERGITVIGIGLGIDQTGVHCAYQHWITAVSYLDLPQAFRAFVDTTGTIQRPSVATQQVINVTEKADASLSDIFSRHKDMYASAATEASQLRAVSLTSGATSKKSCIGVDVVFVMDCTGSMGSWIDAAKKKIIGMADLIKNSAKDAGGDADVKMAFVAYRDFIPGSKGQRYDRPGIDYCGLTSDIQSVKAKISSQEASGGGGDGPEDVCGGLELLFDAKIMNWRDAAAKFVVLIADAPCHGKRYHTSTDAYPDGDPMGRNIELQVKQLLAIPRMTLIFTRINSDTDKMIDVLNGPHCAKGAIKTINMATSTSKELFQSEIVNCVCLNFANMF
jgi:uncharacterized protein YegL